MTSCYYLIDQEIWDNATIPIFTKTCFPTSMITVNVTGNNSALTGGIAVGSDMDQMWVIFCGMLVFFMQCGFTMLEAGAVKATNIQNILFKNLMDACCAAIGFWLFGYAAAYGVADENGFVGTENIALSESTDSEYSAWFFQFAFAATAATIVSGCVAERCTLIAYGTYTTFLTCWVYPVVVHWIWDGDGWLSAFAEDPEVTGGVIDFAGSGVVHMVGGFSGLMGAIFLGPRIGRFESTAVGFGRARSKSRYDMDRMHQHEVGNNVPYQVMGMFFLWFGWYAFNCGSTLAANGAMELASKIAVNTTFGAAMGGVGCALIAIKTAGYWSMPRIVNGVLAGLVSITAGCAVVNPADSLIIGLLGSWVYYGASALLERLRIDDPLDAFAVHGAAGVWGMLAVGLFASDENVAYAGYNNTTTQGYRLSVQLLAVVMIILWVSANIGGLFFILKSFDLLRVDAETEEKGLDEAKHGGAATQYPTALTDQSVDTTVGLSGAALANAHPDVPPAVDENESDGATQVVMAPDSENEGAGGAGKTNTTGAGGGAETEDEVAQVPQNPTDLNRVESHSVPQPKGQAAAAETDLGGDNGYHD